jgi:predicted nuclease of predicted toxin-antitoxin system
MKLLFDHNLSPQLVNRFTELYPDSQHVFLLGMDQDDDRHQRLRLQRLQPIVWISPKVIWIRRGNCSTQAI